MTTRGVEIVGVSPVRTNAAAAGEATLPTITEGVFPVSVRDAALGDTTRGVEIVGVNPVNTSAALEGDETIPIMITGVSPVSVRDAFGGATNRGAEIVGVSPVNTKDAAPGSDSTGEPPPLDSCRCAAPISTNDLVAEFPIVNVVVEPLSGRWAAPMST